MRVGVDTGGTFTDFVSISGGRIEVFKEASTRARPERAILKGLDRLRCDQSSHGKASIEIIHGSTVATNTLLERKGARTALVTTEGFEDVLAIGRQTRRDLYDIFAARPEPLVPAGLRIGLRERTLFDGTEATGLDPGELRSLLARLRREGVESVAVSLLFSFENPDHEQAIRSALTTLEVPISLSSEVLPEHREYERTSTTVVNAYLAPVMMRYLGRLDSKLKGHRLRVMQSNGGAVESRTAMALPVRTILSGPAGGVVGASFLADRIGISRIITFDMGGTSTDVALLDGDIGMTHESQVDGMPIGVPMMDIHTVGAGGGSIATMDRGGALKVGPESAGAEPGPICYGKGGDLTVTDANVVLGRLLPRFFLGGDMKLATERINPAIAGLDWAREWKSPELIAAGVIDVVNNNMEQAIRLISVERGHDLRDFTLVCYGGAGGLHAATLAESLGILRLIVPPHPGALSALGLLLSDARRDYSETLLGRRMLSQPAIRKTLQRLNRLGVRALRDEGFTKKDIVVMNFLDVRYVGQSYELTIPFNDKWEDEFHRAHERRYGHSSPRSRAEIVSARSTVVGKTVKPSIERAERKVPRVRAIETRRVWCEGGWVETPIYDRTLLRYGNVIQGPAVIGEYSSTTYVPPRFRCVVDALGNLVLTRKRTRKSHES